jgi:excisionase family DNA binding protein
MVRETGHLLTIAETARRIRPSESTVRRKIREGQLAAVKLGPGTRAHIRIEADALERFYVPARKEPDDA